jgi:hypothetical protein
MNHGLIDQADRSIEDALVALARAVYLLGFSEGKDIVQHAAGVVAASRRLLHQHGMGSPDQTVTRPGVATDSDCAFSPVAGRALAARDLGGELR